MSKLAARIGDQAKSTRLSQEARAVLEYVVEHISAGGMRTSFTGLLDQKELAK